MLDKLEAIKSRFEEVSEALVSPDVMSDMKKYTSLNKEYKELNKIVQKYLEYKNLLDNIESSKKVLATEKDQDFREMAKEELELLAPKKELMEEEIKQLL
ncbi:MAG TPA: PCRF domain-containing protein, partial [Cytophagaceae bacterium]|nr:PCRF domain-containing protein [Cytophagaceae bacterium]